MALTGKQYKLDKNKDGKISGEDFEMLRKMEMGGATDIAQALLAESGKTISNRDLAKIRKMVSASDDFLKNSADFEFIDRDNMRKIMQGLNRRGLGNMSKERIEELLNKMKIVNKPMKLKKGGEVEAKPKKRTVKKKTSMTSRGAGAALRGTKFVGVR